MLHNYIHTQINNKNNNSIYFDRRLHEEFILILKQIVLLINLLCLSTILTNVNLQDKLYLIDEQTNLMHENRLTITRKLEANTILK
ncbi:unnamed protein product [Rotaria sordida]|uniref:Uncharacterized protein n=1 Tax=Rotaria sordida TaxID=392033 RepID=A0A819R9F7_9BILA|nr:unnamed protein product [Rotaria sordida]CAF1478687.1 unnamed protein product [Rotaria sordida]CAF4038014.1 unnamed protein product [Rotaria sordida]CAF4044277.1 unnamed protein product [Rotaria sordida]